MTLDEIKQAIQERANFLIQLGDGGGRELEWALTLLEDAQEGHEE